MGCIVLQYRITIQSSKLLLLLASTVVLGSESHGTHGHILHPGGSGSLQTSLLHSITIYVIHHTLLMKAMCGRNASLNLHEGMD
jgi:hypothetical protein